MIVLQNKYNNFTDFTFKLFKMAELPVYFSRFSNQMYSNYQHLWMLVYRQYRKMTFQELVEDLHANIGLRQYLALRRVPHYTTLIKFAQKLPEKVLDKLLEAFTKLVKLSEEIAIDATGMSLDNASAHYCKRLNRKYHKRPFMKLSFVVDVKHFFVIACKARKSHQHDVIDAQPLLKQALERCNPKVLYADRGYDDQKFFDMIANETQIYPLILQKNIDVPAHRRAGFFRKHFWKTFDYGLYGNRSSSETTNSIVKRRFGSSILAKSESMQQFDAFLRVIAFNIDRAMRLGYNVTFKIFLILRVSY